MQINNSVSIDPASVEFSEGRRLVVVVASVRHVDITAAGKVLIDCGKWQSISGNGSWKLIAKDSHVESVADFLCSSK